MILDQNGLNFVTLTVVDWVDVLIRKQFKDIIIDTLRYCQQKKGLIICGYVIMSSHIHLVLQTSSNYLLSDILRDFKKYTAKRILQEIETGGYESRKEWLLHRFAYRGTTSVGKRNYQFWQADNHPIILYNLHVIVQKLNYIHNNPIVEGWVRNAEDCVYSSASNYLSGDGLLEVELIDFPTSWVGYLPS